MQRSLFSLLALSIILAAGCGRSDTAPTQVGNASDDSVKEKYLLKSEPSEAKSVGDLRQNAKDGEELVVTGRIGGSGTPFTGKASFTLVDMSLKPCDDDCCGNPWCEADRNELKQKTVLVRFADDKGATLPFDAEKSLALKIRQKVVIRGQAAKSPDGHVSFIASGLYPQP